MPTIYNGQQSPLEAAAIAARNTLIPKNIYNNAASANEYGLTHTRAIADTATPVYGKGTGDGITLGNYSAKDNYKGGGDYDINGNPNLIGSGRNPAISLNGSTWGYGPKALGLPDYTKPNTSANIGQVII